MKSIRIENLRAITDSKDLNINHLNLFLGANSTGKSSILRFFMLMKQTISKKNNEPILWYDTQGVDFGSYEESVNVNNKEKGISFSFNFDMKIYEDYSYLLYLLSSLDRQEKNFFSNKLSTFWDFNLLSENRRASEIEVYVKININKNQYNRVELKVNNFTVCTDFNNKSIEINGKSYKVSGIKYILKDFSLIPDMLIEEKELEDMKKYLSNRISEILFSNINSRINDETKMKFLSSLRFEEDIELFYKKYIFINSVPKTIKNNLSEKSVQEDLYNYFGSLYIYSLLTEINKYITQYFDNVTYIAPVRASAERYYRVQGLSVDDVDSMGTNVPMMLYSMNMNSTKKYNDWLDWTYDNFGIKYRIKKSAGHSAIVVETENGSFNLADTGFGYSQLLPVLLVLWKQEESKNKKLKKRTRNIYFRHVEQIISKTIIIEQPELHLHPAMQAQIADLLMKMIKYNNDIKFIIETHSVAIMNRVGEIIEHDNHINDGTGGNELENKVNVFLVNPLSEDKDAVIKTNYDDEGVIEEWPVGFLSGGVL